MNTVFEVKYNYLTTKQQFGMRPIGAGVLLVSADDIRKALDIAEKEIPERYKTPDKEPTITITGIIQIGELLN